jgi:hypothetical protein
MAARRRRGEEENLSEGEDEPVIKAEEETLSDKELIKTGLVDSATEVKIVNEILNKFDLSQIQLYLQCSLPNWYKYWLQKLYQLGNILILLLKKATLYIQIALFCSK